MPHEINASKCGMRLFPRSLRRYSTRGGTSVNTSRLIMPSSSRWRSVEVSIFCEMSGICRHKSLNLSTSFCSKV